MIVQFEHKGELLVAKVTRHVFDDREPQAFPALDYRYEVRWVDDGGLGDSCNLDALAIAEFEASK